MSRLTLHLKASVSGHVSLRGAVPDRWLELSLAEIAAWPIEVDRRPATIEKAFKLSDGSRSQWLLEGDLERCEFVGSNMRSGDIVVDASVGDYLASGMRGGSVLVHGDAGAYAASSLRDGKVTIEGNVGPYAAAAVPNQSRGMAGGELIVHGNADQWLASRMRRGLVVVHGDVASGCATHMIAGTLAICGRVVTPLGCGMARGTLLLLAPDKSFLNAGFAGFTTPSPSQLSFLPILLQQIAPHLPAELAHEIVTSRWHRCVGDRAHLGLGEVLLREVTEQQAGTQLNPS
ncbi:MAG: formylmethanofuran dehydrogenase subunit C [Aureliella sp.]